MLIKENNFLKVEDYSFTPAIVQRMNPPQKKGDQSNKRNEQQVPVQHAEPTDYYKIFGKSAFLETLVKIAVYHLTNAGNVMQKTSTTYVKCLWLASYLQSVYLQYAQKFADLLEDALAKQ